MSATLEHRGPDSSGVWTDPERGIALGHRRLSIIDLSDAGHQPMTSQDGQFVISYNGEIYNTGQIREELIALGYSFNGYSDTEVIVNGFAAWGVKATCQKLIGMFAIAAWDRKNLELFLVRDRLGIKPLYWSISDSDIIFGSEVKSVLGHPNFKKYLDKKALLNFLYFGYIFGNNSIFFGIQKVEPGVILKYTIDGTYQKEEYWSLDSVIENSQTFTGTDEEGVNGLETLLKDAIKRRMVSDVPLGAFLSGGIDSSTVTALMQSQSSKKIKTFSVGFDDAAYDEARHAKAVATHLGTDHTELYISASKARDVIPQLANIYDEPFADASQIPTLLVSRLARKHVSVCLSGDGGDELFAGYNRHMAGYRMGNKFYRYPQSIRKMLAAVITAFPPSSWDRLVSVLPEKKRHNNAGDKLHKLAKVIAGSRNSFYRNAISHWDKPEAMIKGTDIPENFNSIPATPELIEGFLEQMQFIDTVTYLPDDILTKLDRASMAVSLEARVPLLDHRVVEYAWTLPTNMKIRNGKGKWILRQVLDKYVPQKFIDRPKMGFGVPLDTWLRGPLKEWAEDLVHQESDLLDKTVVVQRWKEHQAGEQNWQYHLWDVLMLQSWLNRWVK